jgi:hypothetical protein
MTNIAPYEGTYGERITEHKIGKTVYVVVSCASDKAKDTLDKKIEKILIKELLKEASNDNSK